MKIRKAVIPVAGLGTRFLPATKASPKEMLALVDKPLIQYVVEEAKASGIEEIVIVTGRGKRAIEDHFDSSVELEYELFEKKRFELLEEIKSISNMVTFAYTRQKKALGLGHAILCAETIVGNEPFAVFLGDDIIDSRIPCMKQLIDV
ncbi:MAG: UTP-glucose-1-phosphate uridylyltransferase [Parcubacteria group bacterium GW2011_GWC2_38_7]|nr:MAG: UTP-glucose-1-phosphate uridylyltransferase [Parcubacteria group bacterium GW2011_GWC2_38_7]